MPLTSLASQNSWLFGSFAIYTNDRFLARLVYETVRCRNESGRFGTIHLESGETIEWINFSGDIPAEESPVTASH